jgi:hypothetical protein
MRVSEINQYLEEGRPLYHFSHASGQKTRIMAARERKGVIQFKSVNTGKWFPVDDKDRLYDGYNTERSIMPNGRSKGDGYHFA